MASFQDILNKKADDVERPKPLPPGTYLGVVEGLPEFAEIGKNQTPVANLKIKLLAAEDDVDSDALREMGGALGKSLRHRLFLTEDAAWRVKQFLEEHLGINGDGKTLGELFNEAPGNQVKVVVKHRPSQDGQTIYAEIDRTLPA
jgi:hypothetical protein